MENVKSVNQVNTVENEKNKALAKAFSALKVMQAEKEFVQLGLKHLAIILAFVPLGFILAFFYAGTIVSWSQVLGYGFIVAAVVFLAAWLEMQVDNLEGIISGVLAAMKKG